MVLSHTLTALALLVGLWSLVSSTTAIGQRTS